MRLADDAANNGQEDEVGLGSNGLALALDGGYYGLSACGAGPPSARAPAERSVIRPKHALPFAGMPHQSFNQSPTKSAWSFLNRVQPNSIAGAPWEPVRGLRPRIPDCPGLLWHSPNDYWRMSCRYRG